MTNVNAENFEMPARLVTALIDANLKVSGALIKYMERAVEEHAKAQTQLTEDSQEPEPDRMAGHSAHEASRSLSTDSSARERECALHEAEVIGVEFVGTSTQDSRRARGVRIQFYVVDDLDLARSVGPAQVYYPLSFNGRTRLREAVDTILQRPLTPVEIEYMAWIPLIQDRRCLLSAYVGVEHSTGRALKFMRASVVQAPPARN